MTGIKYLNYKLSLIFSNKCILPEMFTHSEYATTKKLFQH